MSGQNGQVIGADSNASVRLVVPFSEVPTDGMVLMVGGQLGGGAPKMALGFG